MFLKIADLIVSAPEAGGFTSRYKDYVVETQDNPSIIIDPDTIRWDLYPDLLKKSNVIYSESENIFATRLLKYSGCVFHSSSVALNNRAYLFSGPSGIGKSTHTEQWCRIYKDKAQIINDDKTPVRRIDGKWFAFGSPWCGKNNIQNNTKVSLAGICILKQAEVNSIRRLDSSECISSLLAQTLHNFKYIENMNYMMDLLDKLIREIPVFELENYPGPDCVKLSYETMTAAAEEMGL